MAIPMPMKNWSKSWRDVVFEAHFRASITGWRYRVTYDQANGWWNMVETHYRVAGR